MARSDDLAPLMGFTTQLGPAASRKEDFGWNQGLVISWDQETGENVINVSGTELHNVPVLTSAGIVSLDAGDPVGVLRYKSTYFVLGRIVGVNSGLIEPQFPVILYPQFRPNGAPGTGGYVTVNAGTSPTWEGRIKVSHPKVEIDGIWGNASGSGSVTYALRLDANTIVGEWTSIGLEVGRKGPFDIKKFIGRDWLRIELIITASPGSGEKAFQPLGIYFRQS